MTLCKPVHSLLNEDACICNETINFLSEMDLNGQTNNSNPINNEPPYISQSDTGGSSIGKTFRQFCLPSTGLCPQRSWQQKRKTEGDITSPKSETAVVSEAPPIITLSSMNDEPFIPSTDSSVCVPDELDALDDRNDCADEVVMSPGHPQGFYDNYHAMKQQLIRYPKAKVSSFSGAGTTTDSTRECCAAIAAAELNHITERDVHACFEANETETRMTKTKLVARQFHHHYIGNASWWKQLALRTFPIIGTVREYKKQYLILDLAAGLSAGVAAIPIGVSYSLLAGLPAQHGLYCQLFYCIVYMIFGTGRQVCVGTSAIEAMITAGALDTVLLENFTLDDRTNAAFQLSFFVGLILILMRCLRFGMMACFLSDSVVSGFSTGCAITIATSQLTHLLGITVKKPSTRAPVILWEILTNIHATNIYCVLIGASGIGLLTFIAWINKSYLRRFPLPSSLFVMAVFISLGYLLQISESPYDVHIVADIKSGLPLPKSFKFTNTGPIIQQALWYSVVYFFIHISISKSLAQKHEFTLDCDQELFATGICSVVGSFFQCYPIATSLARTSIADTSGAVTQLYNITNCLTIGLAITVLTPFLYYLPNAALASVVLFGVYWMMYFREAYRLLKLFSLDFILWIVCFSVTVAWGAKEGIITSIALSLLWIVKENAFPATGVLGRLPGTKVFRNIKAFPEAQEVRGCKILRFDASLNFSNADHFQKKIIQFTNLDGPSSIPFTMKQRPNDISSSYPSATPTTQGGRLLQIQKNSAQLSTGLSITRPDKQHSIESRGTADDGGIGIGTGTRISSCTTTDVIDATTMPSYRPNSTTHNTISNNTDIRVVIIDASSINHVDVTSIRMLKDVAKRLEFHNMIMLFANWKGPMREFLERVQFYDTVPPDHCFLSIHDAVLWAEVFYLKRTPSIVKDNDSEESELDRDFTQDSAPISPTGFAQYVSSIKETGASIAAL